VRPSGARKGIRGCGNRGRKRGLGCCAERLSGGEEVQESGGGGQRRGPQQRQGRHAGAPRRGSCAPSAARGERTVPPRWAKEITPKEM
jgi:hypothetical protein